MGLALFLVALAYSAVAFAVVRFTPSKARPVVVAIAIVLPFADSILGRYIFLPIACSNSHYKAYAPITASGVLLPGTVERGRIPLGRVGFVEVRVGAERGIRQYSAKAPIQLDLFRRPAYREGEVIMEGDELIARYQLEESHGQMFGTWIQKHEYRLVDRAHGKVAASGSGFAFPGGQLGGLFTASLANCHYGTEGLVRFIEAAFP